MGFFEPTFMKKTVTKITDNNKISFKNYEFKRPKNNHGL